MLAKILTVGHGRRGADGDGPGRRLAITYRDKNDRSTERVLEPYGVVALRGRWYATGFDSRSG